MAAWTIVDLREFLPDEAVPPIEMGEERRQYRSSGVQAPRVSDHWQPTLESEGSVTIMAGARLGRIALTKLNGHARDEARPFR